MLNEVAGCALCATPGGELIWRGDRVRVIQVDDAQYPGYCRVIWNAHVCEMSDLDAPDRAHLWGVVNVVERAVRDMLSPDKINLASLGNQVPHLHWHVIPRWSDDAHFPDPIWAAVRRPLAPTAGRWLPRREGAAGLVQVLRPLLDSNFPW